MHDVIFFTGHIKKILRKYNFIYCKHVTTHLATKIHLLSINIDDDVIDKYIYIYIYSSLVVALHCPTLDIVDDCFIYSNFIYSSY